MATPDIQTWSVGIGDASSGTVLAPYPGRSCEVRTDEAMASQIEAPPRKGTATATGSLWPSRAVDGEKATTTQRRLDEKSDHPTVVMKPGNAGGARGVTE
jgi:hypothetical protein